jgi:hypothetical protein
MRSWGLALPILAAVACSNPSSGATDAGDEESGTSTDSDSTDGSTTATGTGETGDGNEPCGDYPDGYDDCPNGQTCDENAGACADVAVVPDCDGEFDGRLSALPVGGLVEAEETSGADRLWIAQPDGEILRVDDAEAGTTSLEYTLPDRPLGIAFVDVVEDDAPELVAGLDAADDETIALAFTNGTLSSPMPLFDGAAMGLWVLDSDEDDTDELIVATNTGFEAAGSDLYWAPLDTKPWPLPEVLQFDALPENHAVIALRKGDTRPVLVHQWYCGGDECYGPVGDAIWGATMGGFGILVGQADTWPATRARALRVAIPTSSDLHVVGFARAQDTVVFAAMSGAGVENPSWPDTLRTFPGIDQTTGAAFDYDGDGTLDLAVSTASGFAILVRDDDGLDGCVLRVPTDAAVRDMTVADLDDDGHDDLIASSGSDKYDEDLATTIVFGEG